MPPSSPSKLPFLSTLARSTGRNCKCTLALTCPTALAHEDPGGRHSTQTPWLPALSLEFSLFRLSWLGRVATPTLVPLIPQMKFQHMSPNIIPLRLRITFPQTMSSAWDSSSPKCLPKRLGPLLEAFHSLGQTESTFEGGFEPRSVYSRH